MDINRFLYDVLLENLSGEATAKEKVAYFDIFHFNESPMVAQRSIYEWVTEQLLVWVPDSDSHFFKAILNTVDYDWIYDEFFSEFMDARRDLRYEEWGEEEEKKSDDSSTSNDE